MKSRHVLGIMHPSTHIRIRLDNEKMGKENIPAQQMMISGRMRIPNPPTPG